MPLRFIRSKLSAIDPLQVAISTTALTRDILSSLQFPPATAAISVVLLILETVQSIQTNKVGCVSLARRAAQILVDIDHQMRGRWDSAPERLVQNLQKFEAILISVHQFMKKLADSKWSDRFLRKNSIEDALAGYARLMDEAAQSFQLATLIDLHHTVGTLSRMNTENTEIKTAVQAQIEAPPPYEKDSIQDPDLRGPVEAELGAISISSAATIDLVPQLTGSQTELSFSPQLEDSISEIETDGVRDSLNDHYLPEGLSSLTLDSNHGFRRYHQSDVMLRGRSYLKEGWWAGVMDVQVQGQPALIKKYDGSREKVLKQWLRDVKMLQNLYHPNLPQMLGFSDDEARTPFILLSNVKTRTPEAVVREMLRTSSLATCMELMLRFYRDLSDTALYVQRQLNLTDNQVQDFFEAARFRVDSQKALVVGLPPPREGKWCTARNYGLAHTLLDACLQMLPNRGRIIYSYDKCDEEVSEDMQKKINHLVTLAQSLLPRGSERSELSSKLQKLVEDSDSDIDAPCLTLRQVRDLTFHAGAHEHSWHERNVPACKFTVGDLGYIPRGKDWDSFIRLGNVIEDDDELLKLSSKANGEHWCWENMPVRRQPLQDFELPMNVSGWPVAVPSHKQIDVVVVHEAFARCVKDAWQYLLHNGKSVAHDAGIKPEDIVLVTHSGTHQHFYIKDFRPQPFGMKQHMRVSGPQFAANPQQTHAFLQPPKFGQPRHPASFNQPSLPSIVYLFTSHEPSHEPYWSSSPICAMPGRERHPLERHFTYMIGQKSGFLRYVQLHAEDFESE